MRLAVLSLIMILSGYTLAQNHPYTHGGSDDDIGYCFALNGIGGYVLAGAERTAIDSSEQFSWLNIDSSGNLIWEHNWGTLHTDIIEHIERTQDGGFILGGTRHDGGFGSLDGFIAKVDNQGDFEWSNYYGGNSRDDLFSVKQTSDLGYVMCGFTLSDTILSFGQMFIIKTDNVGNEVWRVYAGGLGKDYAFDVIEASDGSYYAIGVYAGFHRYSTFEFTETHSDILVAKISSSGTLLWENTYGGIENELAYQMKEAPDGGFYLMGSTQSAGNGSFDMNLTKIDSDGNELWSTTYGDVGFDYGRSIDISNDAFLYLTGTTCVDTSTYETDIIVIKTDLNGNEIWSMTYGGSQSDYGNFVRSTDDGGCAVIGNSRSVGAGGDDMYFIKLDADGNTKSLIGNDVSGILVYPNPSINEVNFYIQEGNNCVDYQYEIFNYDGKLVYSEKIASKLASIDISGFAQGTYIYRISSPCLHEHRGKFIVH